MPTWIGFTALPASSLFALREQPSVVKASNRPKLKTRIWLCESFMFHLILWLKCLDHGTNSGFVSKCRDAKDWKHSSFIFPTDPVVLPSHNWLYASRVPSRTSHWESLL